MASATTSTTARTTKGVACAVGAGVLVGVHGVGGLVGTLLVAFLAASALGGKSGADYASGAQFVIQLKSSVIAIVYTLIVTAVILFIVKAICGGSLRVSESEEEEGLDLTAHGESGYN